MNNTFKPTDDQLNLEVSPALDAISQELKDLQQSINCPDDYIAGMLEHLLNDWRD